MKNNTAQKRIEYFDLMKGFCIALVVISHCYEELDIRLSDEHLWSMLEHLRMPLYFFLSGMFFKQYSCFMDFVVRKTNKLIIPYAFFIFVTLIPKLIDGEIACELIPMKKHVTWMIKYGGYLWFLRALFFANILYYGYNKLVERRDFKVKVVILLAITATGWIIDRFMPVDGAFRSDYAYLTSAVCAFMVMPFFYVAQVLKEYLKTVENINKVKLIPMFVVSVLVCYLTSHGGVYLVNAKVENNLFLFYIAALSAITAVWCVSVMINRLWYFSYIGRYSIIVYLTHVPLLGYIVHEQLTHNVYVLMLMLLVLMPLMIWFFRRCFPAFVAQRDILKYDNGKMVLDKTVFSLKNK